MQQAIPSGPSPFPIPGNADSLKSRRRSLLLNPSVVAGVEPQGEGELALVRERTRRAVTESAVVVFGRRGCCMSYVVKRLLHGHGANPAAREFGEEEEAAVAGELERISGEGGGGVQFPAVFIGGKLFGGLDRVMTTHMTGELVPALKEAGALWL